MLNISTIKERINEQFLRLVMWRERHIKERTFVIFLALIVGILCGSAALLLKTLIHFFSDIVTSHINITQGNYLYIIYPVVGIILASLFVRYVVKDNISHGVTRVLHSISQNKSRLKRHNIYSSVLYLLMKLMQLVVNAEPEWVVEMTNANKHLTNYL